MERLGGREEINISQELLEYRWRGIHLLKPLQTADTLTNNVKYVTELRIL